MPSGWKVATHLDFGLWYGIFEKKINKIIVNKHCKVHQKWGVLLPDYERMLVSRCNEESKPIKHGDGYDD